MKYVAYCVKGLEKILEHEIKYKLCEVMILKSFTKLIIFDYNGNTNNLLNIRSADDIGIFISEISDFEKIKSFDLINNISLSVKYLKNIREIKDYFSITYSIVSVEIDKNRITEV